jgi:hypothetical protein
MISFFTPCLRWKILIAYKGQNGWPGFTPPNATRYLQMDVRTTNDQSALTYIGGASAGLGIQVNDYTLTIDRLTGEPAITNPPIDPDMPYGSYLADSGAGESWANISDTYFKHIVPYTESPLVGNAYFITEVSLSNQYTTTQLDADANALLAAVDLTKVPWFTAELVQNAEIQFPIGPYTEVGIPPALPALLGPDTVGFSLTGIQTNIPVPTLPAAAWYVFTPGFVSDGNWYPNGYMKAVGWFSMAGNYALRSYYVDYNLAPLNQTCQNGQGSCSAPFQVTPPPLAANQLPIPPGQDVYVILSPNSQCP